jgi:hypothetical protein
MKLLVTFLLIIVTSLLSAQDTLKASNTFMYSEYYVLNNDNSFEYCYNHCTGIEVGIGTYKKTILGNIKFLFEEYSIQNDTIVKEFNVDSDSISIQVLSVKDSSFLDGIIINRHIMGMTDEYIYKAPSNTDSIVVQYYNFKTIIIQPENDTTNVYKIYLQDYGLSYVNENTETKLLGKSNSTYYQVIENSKKRKYFDKK